MSTSQQPIATTALIHGKVNITFWINQAKANQAGKLPVSMRIAIAGKRAEVSTGIRCLPLEWNKATKRLVSVKWNEQQAAFVPTGKHTAATNALNTTLDDLEARTRLLASDMRQQEQPGRPVTAQALRTKLLYPNREADPEPCALALLEAAQLTYANLFTRASARTAVNRLRCYLAPATTLPLSELTPAWCSKFEAWATGRASSAAARTYSITLSALFSRALPELRNPWASKAKRKVVTVKPRYVLSRAELSALESLALPTKQACIARDIYMAQYYLHGSRVGAVLELMWARVDWVNARVHFKAEKGGDWHNVALRPQLAAILRRYYTPGATGPVFPLLPANYASRTTAERFNLRKAANTYVWRGLQAAAKLLGLPGQLHSHTARHTLATHTVVATGSFRAAQSLLGHHSIAVTEKYVRAMLPDEKDAAADAVYRTTAPSPTTPSAGDMRWLRPAPITSHDSPNQGGRVVPMWAEPTNRKEVASA
jgi:integrase/recombinase XerD